VETVTIEEAKNGPEKVEMLRGEKQKAELVNRYRLLVIGTRVLKLNVHRARGRLRGGGTSTSRGS